MAVAAALCLMTASWTLAQSPAVHFERPVGNPPGYVGAQRLTRGGPVIGYFQPVELRAPAGVTISLAETGVFGAPMSTPATVGLLIGQVYRIRLMNLPEHEGQEVFPTIELVDRLYPPQGQELRFPVVIDLPIEDLLLALRGKFVTRVVYLESPQVAMPYHQLGKGNDWFDVGPGKDPLTVADELGRPMAIVRLGGLVPQNPTSPDMAFLFGSPALVKYPPRPALPVVAPQQPGVVVPSRATSLAPESSRLRILPPVRQEFSREALEPEQFVQRPRS